MPTPGGAADATPDVLFRVLNRVALITLNRPAALNALSHDMVRTLAALVERCRTDDAIVAVVLRGAGDRGFCAGGDVRELYRLSGHADADWLRFFVDEYRLDYALHTFPKPIVALMDGVTMGGGMGLAQGAALRVATERSRIAMPETRIGLVPDVGATHFLTRMPAELALYVGLTGVTLSGADALVAKLADLCVPSAWLGTFEARIENVRWDADVLAALRLVFEPPCNVVPHAVLDEQMPWIVRHFDRRASVERIIATLRQDLARDDLARGYRQWAQTTLDALCTYSPTMLCVTREALLRGRQMTLAESFRMELGIVSRAIGEGDFREGVRAHLVDKDRKPCWAPMTLAAVGAERVRHFLTSPWRIEAHPLSELGGR
ncbi:enoyl-CoA hydratase/isomerase family protein [Burkholderia cenocepacia]|uniref:3-hydroxyisobutyryl-CoA hydrolase n=1 Tax=Burkholderia cenocepacia TaxID=95486 RepID=A0AAN0RZ92_9BURK|nr:enoyl-CoA hydratase/isomerase family protein [Burkholderia cenocepacia]